MNYLKLFENHSEYETFINGGGVILPNVSHCIEENEVHYSNNPLLLNKNYRKFMQLLECAVEQNKILGVSSVSELLNSEVDAGYDNLKYTYGHLIDYLFENDKVEYIYESPSCGESFYDGSHTFKFTGSDNDYVEFLEQENGVSVSIPNNVTIFCENANFTFSSLSLGGCPNLNSVGVGPHLEFLSYVHPVNPVTPLT